MNAELPPDLAPPVPIITEEMIELPLEPPPPLDEPAAMPEPKPPEPFLRRN